MNNSDLEQKITSSFTDIRHAAYVLATVHHETGGTMKPIRERGGPKYFFKMYDPESPDPDRAKQAKRMGALPGDGVIYYGRGYVQITWRLNYRKFGRRHGVNLESNPDLALDPDNALRILVDGMTLGMFTGKKLSDYINAETCDYFNARRIINGIDCAQKIADKATEYYSLLASGNKVQ